MDPRTHRRLTLAAALVAATSVGGCDLVEQPARDRVTLSVVTLDNPFFRQLRAGARSAAEVSGVRLQVVSARDDAGRQARQLDRAVARGAEAVLLTPVNPEEAARAVRPAKRAEVPVVAVDRRVDARVDSTVTSDNDTGGRLAAEAIGEAFEGPGLVIHLQGDPQTSVSQERGEGFARGLEALPEVDLATKQPAYFDRETARRVTSRLLRFYPDTNAIFAESDQMALGAVDALGDRAGDEVVVVGFDGIPEALDAVEAGTMEATVAQRPDQLGRIAMEQAVAAIDGAPVAPRVPVGVELVTEGNVGQFR